MVWYGQIDNLKISLIINFRKNKGKADLPKEDEFNKEQEPHQEVSFIPPGDNNLMKYIEDVLEKIQPLPTSRLQIQALAQ